MALTKFVRNVDDLSDDGGYKFRFHCDRCNDGVESQYVSSSANLLKTGLEIFSMFKNFGSAGRYAAEGIDRRLRGKDAMLRTSKRSTKHRRTSRGARTAGSTWAVTVGTSP